MDRRPIRSRGTGWAQAISVWLAGTGITPNAISVLGMIAGLAAGALLVSTSFVSNEWVMRGLFIAAAVCVQVRLLANLFDGMVAVHTGKASAVGELFNEVPDRISDVAVLIGAGYAVQGAEVLGYGAALVAVFTAYVRAMGKAAGVPSDFRGPMAKQQRMFVVTVMSCWLALTPVSWRVHWGPGGAWGLMGAALMLIVALGAWTACRRLRRTAHILRDKTCP